MRLRHSPDLRKLRKLVRLSQSKEYRRGLRLRVAAAVEHEAAYLQHEPATVLDVGANRGQFALFVTEAFPSARLVCFEPLPTASSVLKKVLSSHPSSELHEVALSGTAGQTQFHQSLKDDSSSLLPLTERQEHYFPKSVEVATISVPTRRLDDCIDGTQLKRPCLLKLDVQGAEMQVLEGAPQTLRSIDEIIVECSFVELYSGQPLADDVICGLKRLGFSLTGVSKPTYGADGRPLQVDATFVRRD